MGLRPTSSHQSPQPVIPSGALHRLVQGGARNLLLMFFCQKQIPRRFAHRNDMAVG